VELMSEMQKQTWRAWLKAAGIRAVKTFAQAFIACLPVTATTMAQVDWGVAASTACVAAILSLLTSLAGLPEAESPVRGE
jgi:uncharacterized membrane protein YdjX (TVP38/TMEM64 family)